MYFDRIEFWGLAVYYTHIVVAIYFNSHFLCKERRHNVKTNCYKGVVFMRRVCYTIKLITLKLIFGKYLLEFLKRYLLYKNFCNLFIDPLKMRRNWIIIKTDRKLMFIVPS